MITPQTRDEAAAALRDLRPRRVVGAMTKLAIADGQSATPSATAIDARDSDCLTTRHLTRIVEYSPADMTITVEAGLTLDALSESLAANNLRLPLDPPSFDGRATIGGILAAADSGPLRHLHGGPRDLVLGMSILQFDGTRIRSGGRVVKNVAGYALHRLLVGSWGRLAMIETVTLRLRPRAESLRLVSLAPRDAVQAESWTAAILAGNTRPAFIEWLRDTANANAEGPALELIVGYEDFVEAADWQAAELARTLPARILSTDEASAAYLRLRDWGASANIRAAMPGHNLHRIFDDPSLRRVALQAHAAPGALLARANRAEQQPLITAIRAAGGHVLAPLHAATTSHPALRARLARALIAEAGA